MVSRDLADWDPIRDGSYLAALLDHAAKARDLKRMETDNMQPLASGLAATWRAPHTKQARAVMPCLKEQLPP